MLESEKKFVDDMNLFQQQVINKLVTLLPQDSLSTLQTHHGALIQAHQINVLSPLTQSTSSDSHQQQRIGKLFLTAAPQIQAAHKTYATFHPTAVQIVEKHKHTIDQWWTSNNQNEQSGVLKIITGLSAPFRRLDKYATLLQELQRMMEEYHRDRGDVQRSVAVFRDLEKTCRNLRKEKEMELEVLTPGAINDFEGAEVSSLGDIVLMSLVYVGKESTSRYFVLFSNTMLILSYDNSGNTFTYHGRIQVSGITVSDVPDSNGFEISGPTVHTMLVVCGSKSLKVRWMNALTDQLRASRSGYVSSEQVCYGMPYVSLVCYFKHLHEIGVIKSVSSEFLETYERNVTVRLRCKQMGSRFIRVSKTRCLSKLNCDECVWFSNDSIKTRSLESHSVNKSILYLSMPWNTIYHFKTKVLVRQNAFDFTSSNDSLDSGLGDSCVNEIFLNITPVNTYVSTLYAHWCLKFEPPI
ncbi:unnamed protein product [Orchesella dallaii]|uniref:DH domain-containing protein n=1 Tax=Orchesella dallaii TaxID=48710 RepID=A0ABP1QXC2_9HEXA